MDKSFNFFKAKIKKQTQKTRNYSKSNSSKASGSKYSYKAKEEIPKASPLTQREKEIRVAIELRFQKSKLRNYRFQRQTSLFKRKVSSSHSSDHEQYQHLKQLKIVDLKEYHRKQQSVRNSEHSSRERPVINLQLKLTGVGLRTQGNERVKKAMGRSVNTLSKTPLSKKKEQWRFISIQMRQNSKQKSYKAETNLSSHRSCMVIQGPKMKSNSSLQKGFEKTKTKDGNRFARTRF